MDENEKAFSDRWAGMERGATREVALLWWNDGRAYEREQRGALARMAISISGARMEPPPTDIGEGLSEG